MFYQNTVCDLRCTDTATAVVDGTTYYAQQVEITMTAISVPTIPYAACTFPDLIISTINPGDTITIVLQAPNSLNSLT